MRNDQQATLSPEPITGRSEEPLRGTSEPITAYSHTRKEHPRLVGHFLFGLATFRNPTNMQLALNIIVRLLPYIIATNLARYFSSVLSWTAVFCCADI